jgi:thiamine pyrophosphate-dependent acetolactate synthase large subunit-like protein
MEQEKLVAQFCKWVATLHSPAQLPTLVSTLLRRAVSGRPGPVALIIPQDVFDQAGSIPATRMDGNLGRFPYSRSSPAASDVERAALLLAEANRPVMIAGGGAHVADAAAEVRPMFYQCCGTEDFLYEGNLRFKERAASLGLNLTYEEGPGEHEWGYWDRQI